MKNKLIVAALFIFALGSNFAYAQKMGYVDSRAVSDQMPEVKAVSSQLSDYAKQKQQDLQKDIESFQKRVQEFEQNSPTMSEDLRNATQRELQALQEKLQIKQTNAQTDIQTKEKQLFEPIEKRIQDAINKVATENGYTYVLSKEVLLHYPADGDISSLVVKKLKETAPAGNSAGTAPKTNTPATPAPKKK